MMNVKYERKIETGIVATPNALDVMRSVIGQMSDGIWENSPSMCGYWATSHIEVSENDTIVIALVSYREVWYYGKWIVNRWYSMSDAKVLKFFANKIAQIAKIEGGDNKGICAKLTFLNDTVSRYMDYGNNTTFGHAYSVRWSLLGDIKDLEVSK